MSVFQRRDAMQVLRFGFIVALVAFLTLPIFAQTAARIEGSVQDPTGAVIAGAKITATNTSTHAVKATTSNAAGLFAIPALQPGTYRVSAEAAGFSTSVMETVEVNVAATTTTDFKLTVGKASEIVEVQATSVAVNTADSTVGRAVTMKEIDTLPQLGRTPITLAVFSPGVQMDPTDTTFSRINGQRQGSNNSTLDGIDANDSVVPRLGLSLTANNTDSVGEFRIITQGGKAEYGRNAGGQVELVTRNGTNKLHGNAFEYMRRTDLNANEYFNKQSGGSRPLFHQDIWGGSIGGAIIHNRSFFFGNFQRRDTKQQTVRNRTVYTQNARNGLFTYTATTGGAAQTYNIVANDPRKIGIDKAIAANLNLIPLPNNSDVGDGLNTGGFRFNQPANSFEDQFTIRGDHNINSRMKAFIRWSWQRNSSIDTLNNADAPFPGQIQGTQGGHRWGYSIGHDWTITNKIVNEFRIGHQSASVAFNRPGRLSGPMIVTNLVTDPQLTAFAQGRNSPVLDIIDNITWTHGNHIFKFGGKFSNTQQQGYNFAGIYPNLGLGATTNGNTPTVPSTLASIPSGQRSTYQSLYNDLFGRLNSYSTTFYSTDLASFQPAGSPRVRNHIINEHGYYFQDDWKYSRNLTFNYGVRWELFLPPHEENGIQASVVNAGAVTLTNKATDLAVTRNDAWFKTDWNNFGPRFGFAYDVKGDGKTAIRGNFGVFFDRIIGATVSAADGNTPGFSTTNSQFPQLLAASDPARSACGSAPVGDVRISDCLPGVPNPAAPVTTLPVAARTTTITLFNPNLRTGYVQSFGLNIQREVFRNTILDVGYVGARGVKLFMQRDLNQVRINEDFLAAFKQIQANLNNLAAVPSTNTLVKMFGSASSAVSSLGSSNFSNGLAGAVANTLDRNFNSRYVNAGLPQTYLRNYPQYNGVQLGTNDGRNYYDALQVSVRRIAGAFRVNANYTWSKSIDNISVDANGFTSPVDNFNLNSNRAVGDADHRQNFNASFVYSLPFGKGKRFGGGMPRWADEIVGGWELGDLFILQDGRVYTISSTRQTYQQDANAFSNYAGQSGIGGAKYTTGTGAVFYYTAADFANFTFPDAGTIGNSGRNRFRGPGFFNTDLSLVKRFKITERQSAQFRAEAYNLLNKPNWGNPSVDINNPLTFGKISSTIGTAQARIMQLTFRYDF